VDSLNDMMRIIFCCKNKENYGIKKSGKALFKNFAEIKNILLLQNF
jgi:hypothetical protein